MKTRATSLTGEAVSINKAFKKSVLILFIGKIIISYEIIIIMRSE